MLYAVSSKLSAISLIITINHCLKQKNPDLHRDFCIELKTITFQQQFRKLIQRLHLCVNEL